MNQRELLAQLLTGVDANVARARALTSDLSDAQLRWTPPDGGWSIAQVFEHLIAGDSGYLERMRALVNDPATARRRSPDAPWTPSLMGGLLTNSLRAPRKMRAPRKLRPTAEPRPRVVEAYLRVQGELAELLRAAAAIDLQRARMSSTIIPIIRMNLGDAFSVLVVHTDRHLRQVERLRARPEFPRSA